MAIRTTHSRKIVTFAYQYFLYTGRGEFELQVE